MFSQFSIDYVSSMQIGQKHVSFLLSNENTFWKVFVLIECKSRVPWIVLASNGIDMSISWIPICQKNLSNINNLHIHVCKMLLDVHIKIILSWIIMFWKQSSYLCTSFDCWLQSWLIFTRHHWTTWLAHTNLSTEWFIWCLRRACFTHTPAPSFSPFPWPISKKFQWCLIFVFYEGGIARRMIVNI